MIEPTDSKLIEFYQYLVEISLDLASTLDLDELLTRILHSATHITEADEASILLYDEKRKELYFQAATNITNRETLSSIVVPTESIAGWVALHREPVIVPDVEKDKRWFSQVGNQLHFKTRSIIAVPLVAKEKLIGVLEVLNKIQGTFDQEDQDKLVVLAAQAAIAIENSRLFKQSDLISELVHELRTPLTSIGTISYLLQRPNVSEDQRLSLTHTINQEIQRLNELTTSFLDFARLESGRASFNMQEFDLKELLQECCQITEHKVIESGLSLFQEYPETLPALEADRDKIKQVLLNLLSNAIKYNRPQGKIFLKAGVEGNLAWLVVQDTGMGMPAEVLPHLFEKFFRVKATENIIAGTGLGLSICKRIVEGHRGRIEVQSQVNSGSTFTIYLPLKRSQGAGKA